MRAKAGIFIIICLLFLVGTVAAVGIPDTVIVSTNKPWIIANNVDQSIITVTVMNTTTTPTDYSGVVQGVTVNLAVNDNYGTLSPVIVTTDASGKASSTFKVKTKSGAPDIFANITSLAVSGSGIQNIDHDSPYYSYFSYPLTGEVNSEILFNIYVTDRWANPLDNRKEIDLSLPNHTVSLHVHGPAPDDCGFSTSLGYIHDANATLDDNGKNMSFVRLTSKIGNNYILMDPFGSISEKVEWIVAEANGVPYSINGTISNGGSLPVNTIPFTIDYFLYDEHDNPVRNRTIWVNTTPFNEQKKYTSNSRGQIRLYYGPLLTASDITITATAIDYPNAMNITVAHFVNSGPTNMVLAVTPQTMASRDAHSIEQAFVRATVIDSFGNPVSGELVTFSLGAVSAVGFNQTAQPTLSGSTAITDSDGNAIVFFYPGSFARRGEPGYSGAATGNVVVTATWNEIPRSATATWKNYAYLSIIPSAEPHNVRLNDTIDITIEVIGNGYNLQGGNVAAIVDLDSSSSIWSNPDVPGPKRVDSAKEAAKAFSMAMLLPWPTGNWIGVDSYGNEKKDDERLLAPQNIYNPLVEGKITNMIRGTNSQGFGASIIDSINNLTHTQPSRDTDKVRAVIALKDSGGGNLEANGQTQAENDADAVIALANSTHPKTWIFTVYYYDGISESSSTQTILRNIANRSGGKFFRSENSTQLKLDFIEIATILKTAAGVNATMALDFVNIDRDSTPVNGSDAFSYVPVGPFYNLSSTSISRDAELGRTRIFWPNSSHSVINQSDEWTISQNLHFNIGTINISERWNATYRLKAINQTGLINLFNCTMSGSTVSYNDNEENVCLPNLYIMVTNSTPTPNQTGLDVSNLAVTKSGNITEYVPLEWNLKYDGFATATETMWYSYNNGPWVQYDTLTGIASGNYTQIGLLDVRKLPQGSYRIKVHGFAPDTLDDEEIVGPVMVGYSGSYIRLS